MDPNSLLNPFEEDDAIHVEVVYATPVQQELVAVRVPKDSHLDFAIRQSKICDTFPEIDLDKNSVGIFGKKKTLDTVLKSGDRVEIYRELKADPKEVRRALAALGKTMGKKL
ncbi:MAG: RnfH family protein [Pseudomonadota bacterium]